MQPGMSEGPGEPQDSNGLKKPTGSVVNKKKHNKNPLEYNRDKPVGNAHIFLPIHTGDHDGIHCRLPDPPPWTHSFLLGPVNPSHSVGQDSQRGLLTHRGSPVPTRPVSKCPDVPACCLPPCSGRLGCARGAPLTLCSPSSLHQGSASEGKLLEGRAREAEDGEEE